MGEEKLKVIIATDGLFPETVGGMQRHSRLLIESLAGSPGLSLTVIHPYANSKVLKGLPGVHEIGVDDSPPNGFTRNLFKIRGLGYLFRAYLYSRGVFRVIMEHPDAVIYAQGLAVWYGIRRIRQPLAINPHGLEPYQVLTRKEKRATWPLRVVHDYLFRHADRLISLGGRLTGILERKCKPGRDHVVVIPNAVNAPAEPTKRRFDAPVVSFLFVGRFAGNKGIPYLAEAIRMLNESGYADRMRFHLVGGGVLLDSVRQQCTGENVHIYGPVDDDKLKALYGECDMFVLPTLFEGMPTVVLEAMAAGLPVMVTDTGATLELVDETNGYIIEKRSPDAIRKSAIRFLELGPGDRKRMSEASIRKVRERFTWQAVANKHLELFRQMAGSHD